MEVAASAGRAQWLDKRSRELGSLSGRTGEPGVVTDMVRANLAAENSVLGNHFDVRGR